MRMQLLSSVLRPMFKLRGRWLLNLVTNVFIWTHPPPTKLNYLKMHTPLVKMFPAEGTPPPAVSALSSCLRCRGCLLRGFHFGTMKVDAASRLVLQCWIAVAVAQAFTVGRSSRGG